MTLVAACKFWKTLTVIADCRVSYLPPYDEVDDCLQKIYRIGDRLVLGFAGPLQGAHKVMNLVRDNLAEYSRHPVASNLATDVERWIRHEYGTLSKAERETLSFLVATIEPRRMKRDKGRPDWIPPTPEWSIFVLRPSKSRSGELVKDRRSFAEIIGVQGEDRKAVEEILMECYGFAFKQPCLQMQAIMGFLKYRLMTRGVRTVGGLFQCAMLGQDGIRWLGYSGGSVVLEPVGERFVQKDIRTGKTLPLMSIWEWAEKKPAPGSFGTFEDADLLQAVERFKNEAAA